MAISWKKLAERVGISLPDITEMRKSDDAPKNRNISEWKVYTAKNGKQQTIILPGENTYDQLVADGLFSYSEAVAREKATEQQIINKRRLLEYERELGKLISIEQHRDALLRQQDALISCLSQLTDIASADFVPAEKMKIRKKSKRWIDKIRRLVADKLEGPTEKKSKKANK